MSVWQSTTDPDLYKARQPASVRPDRPRKRYRARNETEAIQEGCERLGLVPVVKEPERVEIAAAFLEALEDSRRGKAARDSYLYFVEKFVLRLPQNLKYWDQITRQHLREYLTICEGKADNTRRLAMQPIQQAANYMEREYDARNVTRALRLGNKNKRQTPRVYLADVLDFLDYLVENQSDMEAGIALQRMFLQKPACPQPLNLSFFSAFSSLSAVCV